MNAVDWTIAVALNGGIILSGILRGRATRTSADWFLAGRSLPWWVIGLSLYATAIDASDLVADAGGTYTVGMSYLVTNWVGVTLGWFLLANWIAVPMYRAGMYTNAEYLEARFGLSARVVSALVQALYRTLVLAIIARTLYLLLAIVCGLGVAAWWSVVLIATLATAYTVMGGLRAVAMTDALQSVVMVVASVALFCTVWMAADGWAGLGPRLDRHEDGLSDQLLRAGTDDFAIDGVAGESSEAVARRLLLGGELSPDGNAIVTRSPAWLIAVAWLILGLGYAVVNHTQSMRLFGARSEWDMRMAVVVSGLVLLVLNFTNLSIGIFGRALYPDPGLMPLAAEFQTRDSVFPLIVRELTSVGVRGMIVAGVIAACFSTFDSIGSSVPSLLVRDVFARLVVPDRPDSYYLAVSRWLTPAIILGSFAFVPLLMQERGMLLVFLDWVGAFVVPLLAVYLLGAFTRVHRSSAIWGLAVGMAYGTLKLLAPVVALRFGVALLPAVMVNNYASVVISLLLTAVTMLSVSAVRGWESSGRLRDFAEDGWLRDSRSRIASPAKSVQTAALPVLLGGAVVACGLVLSFVVFW